MFIIIELSFVLTMLWLIANIVHFFYTGVTKDDELEGHPFFCLSNKWLKDQRKPNKGDKS